MAEATWEKTLAPARKNTGRWKFLVGGLLILAAVAYLIISSTMSGARYYMTVDDLVGNSEYVGKTVRISGAVLGDTIEYDSQNLIIKFTVANVPNEYDNLALALHEATIDPNRTRMPVVVENQVKPDLLQNEAQAILTGKIDEKGVFHASELLLKCPTRFEEADPGKAITNPEA